MLFKLRCRKFIELILIAADALKRTRVERTDGLPQRIPAASTETAQISLTNALVYGQQLELDYKDETRPEIATYLKKTFSVVAYEDPLNVVGEVGKIAGQESRNTLAMEMNEAILGTPPGYVYLVHPLTIENITEVLGKPTQPALEYIYRQTSACLGQLGLMGVGSAVFADPAKEFFEP
jgi:Ran-binding protein 9/10